LILPSSHPEAVAGFVIMEQTEYPPMSGSNTMCVATVMLKTGMVPLTEPVTEFGLEAPAGLVRIRAETRDGRVGEVAIQNQPAFPIRLDAPVEVSGFGTITVDVAYGGMMYVIFEAADVGLELRPDEGADIVRIGQQVKAATREQIPAVHPENPAISGVTVAQVCGPATTPGADLKNTVVVSTGELSSDDPSSWRGCLDRSPCGTGTCAKMSVLHARGELEVRRPFVYESIIGTTFTGRILDTCTVGSTQAIVPEIAGRAWITGFTTYCVEDDDPFPEGFTVGDIWGPSGTASR
jgi:proline racemase